MMIGGSSDGARNHATKHFIHFHLFSYIILILVIPSCFEFLFMIVRGFGVLGCILRRRQIAK